MKRRASRGFTLVELLIVIVVIAILAAITIVAYNGVTAKARASAIQSDLKQDSQALESYKVSSGGYPTSLTAANIQTPTSGTPNYYTVGTTSYCLQIVNGTTSYSITSTNQAPVQGDCTTAGLVGWYKLDGDATDSIGSNDGTVTGASLTTGATGNANGAYSFTGSSSQLIAIPSTFGIGTSDVTLSMWVNDPSSPSHGAFIKVGSTGHGFGIGVGTTSDIGADGTSLTMILENQRWVPTGATMPTGGWHLVVMELDDNGTPSAYLDNTSLGSFPGTASNNAPLPPTTNVTDIGGYNTSSRFFTGGIDDVRIYNRQLSAAEVTALYNAGAQ